MPRFAFTLCVLFLISCSVVGQGERTIDSLYLVYEKASDKNERFRANQELVWEYLNSDRKLSREIFNREHENILKEGTALLKVISLRQSAVFTSRDGDNKKAIRLNGEAREILQTNKSEIGEQEYRKWMSNLYYGDGNYYSRVSELSRSNECYIEALKWIDQDADEEKKVNILINLGINYYLTNNYQSAIEKYSEGLIIAKRYNSARSENLLYQNLGLTYKELGLLDSAKVYLAKSSEFAKDQGDLVILLESLLGLSVVYEDQSIIDSAILTLELAIEETKDLDYILGQSQVYLNLGRFQRQTGNLRDARKNFLKFTELNSSINNAYLHEQYLRSMAELENDEKNYKEAYQLLYEGTALHDSLISTDHKLTLESIENDYKTAKQNEELAQQEILIGKQANQRNLMLAAGVFSLFLAFFFWYRKVKSDRIRLQQQRIDGQRIGQLEKEKKILSMNAMIEGQEAERTRIAKDLHDGLGGLLSTVKAHFSNIQSEIEKVENLKVYDRAQEMMDEACEEVRRISHNLMPGSLRLEGLVSAVDQLTQEMNSVHPFDVKVKAVNFSSRLDENREVFVYRIIQEALNNIIRHAQAQNVLIQLSEGDDVYHFMIEDDGVGFDALDIDYGLGLKSIESRVEFLKGELDVDARPNIGTTISFSIPKQVS